MLFCFATNIRNNKAMPYSFENKLTICEIDSEFVIDPFVLDEDQIPYSTYSVVSSQTSHQLSRIEGAQTVLDNIAGFLSSEDKFRNVNSYIHNSIAKYNSQVSYDSIKHLIREDIDQFNKYKKVRLNANIKKLILNDDQFESILLPTSLTELTMDNMFNRPLVVPLPKSLTRLILGNMFNHPLGPLPPNLIHLELGRLISTGYGHGNFNQPLGELPSSLTHLILGIHFNHPLGPLPPNLIHLELGSLILISNGYGHDMKGDFNQPLGELPSSLTHLILGRHFNHPLGTLPPSLTHLTMGYEAGIDDRFILEFCDFDQPLGELPTSLTHLSLGWSFVQPLLLPLPPNLTHLKTGHYFDHPLGVLPANLVYLKLGNRFEQQLGELPMSLTYLEMQVYDEPFCLLHNIDITYLVNLTHLQFNTEYEPELEIDYTKLPPNATIYL